MNYILISESFNELNKEFSFLKRNPNLLPLFKKIREDENVDISELRQIYYDLVKHKNTIKSLRIILLDAVTKEDLIDILGRVKSVEKFNKFVKLLPNNLRNEIKDSESLSTEYINIIMDFSYNEYKNIFLKKVAKYKTPIELFVAIKNYIKVNSKSKREIIQEIEELDDIENVFMDDTYLVARIYSKSASCALGSNVWCISGARGESWEHYVPNKKGVQYFVWDFSEEPTSNLYQIGITATNTDDFTAFDKFDDSIKYYRIYKMPYTSYLKPIDKLDTKEIQKYLTYNPTTKGEYLWNKFPKEDRKQMLLDISTDSISLDYGNLVVGFTIHDMKEVLKKNPILLLDKTGNMLEVLFTMNFKKAYEILRTSEKYFNDTLFTELSDNYHKRYFSFDSDFYKNMADKFLIMLIIIDTDMFLKYFSFTLNSINTDDSIIFDELEKEYHKDWKRVSKLIGKYSDKIHNIPIRQYLDGGLAHKIKNGENLYIFIGAKDHIKVGMSERGKDIYEETIKIENLIKYNPIKNYNDLQGIKIRSKYTNQKVYGIWVNNSLLDEPRYYHDDIVDNYGQEMVDLIQDNMFIIK